MIDQQTYSEDIPFLSSDDVYLVELADRITKLRQLQEQMENKPARWDWVKVISE